MRSDFGLIGSGSWLEMVRMGGLMFNVRDKEMPGRALARFGNNWTREY